MLLVMITDILDHRVSSSVASDGEVPLGRADGLMPVEFHVAQVLARLHAWLFDIVVSLPVLV